MQQFDKLDTGYASFVGVDAMRNGLHYPEIERKLKEVRQGVRLRVLDVGCGDGRLARLLASGSMQVQVTGFDSAHNLVTQARQEETTHPLGIQYEEAAAHDFETDKQFDDAVSVMVLPYAKDPAYLAQFFQATCKPLESGGRFISVVFNPDFKAFDERIGNRMFTRTDDGRVEVHFLDPQTLQRAFKKDEERVFLTQFSKEEYEVAAKQGGFASVQWEPLQPTQEAVEKFGEEFWEKCIKEQPYALVIAQK